MRDRKDVNSGIEKLFLLATRSSMDSDRAMTSIAMRTSRVGDILRFQ